MNQNEIKIFENISKIKVNNAFESISRKDDNYRLAQEIYEDLYQLKQENKEQYRVIIEKLNIKDVDNLIDFKEKFIEILPKMVVPNDHERTILNVVELVKSEKMYYSANKTKTKTDDHFTGQVDVLEFMLLSQKNIKFEYIGSAIGFAISGNMIEEFNKIQDKQGNVTGTALWNSLKECNKRVIVDFKKINSPDIDEAVTFKEQIESLRGANIVDGWFFDEKNKTIYPIFCSSSESLESQDCQYFEKIAILKIYAKKHNLKIAPIYLTNSYFNESFNGDILNENQQHSTDFLNSFSPKLTKQEKNSLNHSIFSSTLGNLKYPNDIHESLNISDILMCNMFAVGADTEELAQKFILFNSLPSPEKEKEFFNFTLNKINEMLVIIKKTNGLDTSNLVTMTMLDNIDNMISGLDNFNLSNMPDNLCFHLSFEQMEQMTNMSENLLQISKKTKSYSKTKLSKNKRISNFNNLDKIETYYSQFYEETSLFFDYKNSKISSKSNVSSKAIFDDTRRSILTNSSLLRKLSDIAYENIHEEHTSKENFVRLMIDAIAIKKAFPETPIASLNDVNFTLYQSIKNWEKNITNSDENRIKGSIIGYIFQESNFSSIDGVVDGLANREFMKSKHKP